MVKLIINKKYNNKKILNVLLDNFNGLSSPFVYKILRKKDIKLNGNRIKDNIPVFTGDVLEIFVDDKYLYKTPSFNTIYEDDNIVIINKPKHIEVLSNGQCLTSLLQAAYENLEENFPYPCHRLDRNTSGLVIFAKNKDSLDILNAKFLNGEIDKFYLCTVIGILEKKQNILKDYLFKDTKKSIVYVNKTKKVGYKEIITSYKVISEDKKNNLSTLEVSLHTGRTHQIRAHLAYIGHPILR